MNKIMEFLKNNIKILSLISLFGATIYLFFFFPSTHEQIETLKLDIETKQEEEALLFKNLDVITEQQGQMENFEKFKLIAENIIPEFNDEEVGMLELFTVADILSISSFIDNISIRIQSVKAKELGDLMQINYSLEFKNLENYTAFKQLLIILENDNKLFKINKIGATTSKQRVLLNDLLRKEKEVIDVKVDITSYFRESTSK